MGELRERMQQALVVHGMAPRTQGAYLAAVQGLATYYHQRPDTLSEDQIQAYVHYLLAERQLAPNSVRVAMMGLRSRAHGAEGRAPEHRSREAQRAACRSAAGWRSRQSLEAASAESEGP